MKKGWLKSRKGFKRSSGTLVSIFILISLSFAQASAEGPGTTGALFLRLPVSPKSISMGEASAALPDDPFGWLSNPGLMRDLEAPGFGLYHSQWIVDTYYDNAFVNIPVNSFFSAAAGITYFSAPDVAGFDEFGISTGDLKNNNFQGIIGLCFKPIPGLGAGINLKYFQEKLAYWTASGFGMDIGAVYRIKLTGLSFGAAVRNIGPTMAYISREEKLPMTVRLGGAYSRSIVPGIAGITISADMVKPSYEEAYPSIGAELTLRDIFSVRGGYCGEKEREHNGLTAGAGIRLLGTIALDYAWTPYGDLGNFHRVSVHFSR